MTHRAEWLGPEAGCRTILDYGCGSGVLALAALTLAGDPSPAYDYASTMPLWTILCTMVPALCHYGLAVRCASSMLHYGVQATPLCAPTRPTSTRRLS